MTRCISTLLLFLTSVSLLTACDQRQSFRVLEIEYDYASGNDQVHTYSYTDDNQIDEIEIKQGDDRLASWEFTYDGNRLIELEYEVPGQADVVYTFTWEDNRLTEREDVQSGSYSAETNYDYNDSGLFSGYQRTTSSDSESVMVTDIELEYDDDERITEWEIMQELTVFGVLSQETTTHEYSYDGDGRLDEVETQVVSDFGGIESTANSESDYDYTDTDTLREVNTASGETEISYDEDNRIAEIEVGNDLEIRYTYEDGAAPSLIVEPSNVPQSLLFDLSGKGYSQVSFESLGFLLN